MGMDQEPSIYNDDAITNSNHKEFISNNLFKKSCILFLFNKNLCAIMKKAKYFEKEELKTLITSLFFSKIYYVSEAWHLPERTNAQIKQHKFSSANALRITIFNTHTEIHCMT